MGGELVFEAAGELGEAFHFALVFVDVLNGDDAAGDVAFWSMTGAALRLIHALCRLVSSGGIRRAEGAAVHDGVRREESLVTGWSFVIELGEQARDSSRR